MGELPMPKVQHQEKVTLSFLTQEEMQRMREVKCYLHVAAKIQHQLDGRVKVTVRKEMGGQHRDFHTQHLPQMRFKLMK